MSAKSNDTVFLAIGGLALVGAGVWALLQQSRIDGFRGAPNVPTSGTVYQPTSIKVSSPATERWEDARSQSAGEKWIYDVFTPPKIYYNTQSKQFTVVPPERPTGPSGPVVPKPPVGFGLDLVKVEQSLFRLQLVGYVGEGEQARGNFLNVATGAVVFGTTGKKLPDLNLEIVKFSAERRRVVVPGGTTQVFIEPVAVVRDTQTGAEYTLDTKSRLPDGPPVATFRQQADGVERSVKGGESLSIGDTVFTVGALTIAPPSAVVTRKVGAQAEPETRTLLVPPPAPPAPAPETDGEIPPVTAPDSPALF
jgi:hypothetical protein